MSLKLCPPYICYVGSAYFIDFYLQRVVLVSSTKHRPIYLTFSAFRQSEVFQSEQRICLTCRPVFLSHPVCEAHIDNTVRCAAGDSIDLKYLWTLKRDFSTETRLKKGKNKTSKPTEIQSVKNTGYLLRYNNYNNTFGSKSPKYSTWKITF